MSNIYIKVTKWRSKNYNFLSLKSSSPGQFLGSPNSWIKSTQLISLDFQISCCNLKMRGLGVKLCAAFILF